MNVHQLIKALQNIPDKEQEVQLVIRTGEVGAERLYSIYAELDSVGIVSASLYGMDDVLKKG